MPSDDHGTSAQEEPADDPVIADDPSRDSASASVDGLAEELRRVAGMRSPKALRDAHLPILIAQLEAPDDLDRRLDGFRSLLTTGIAAIADPQFRSAAEALFGFGSDRWTPLQRRGEQASASFNCSFDAYRRARRSTGVSLLDETVRQLALAIHKQQPGTDDTTDPVIPVTDPAGQPRRSKTPLLAAAVIVVAAVVVAIVLAVTGQDDSQPQAAAATTVHRSTPPSSVAPTSMCHEIGESDDPTLADYRVPFETRLDQLTPPGEAEPCAQDPVGRWDQLVVQNLTKDGVPDGALVATDPDHVLLMTQAEFSSYHQIGGKDGTQAQALAGLPRRRAMSTSGAVWLIITDHGAMASSGVDQPGFYLGGPVWNGWQDNGEDGGDWGVPASNPLNNAVGYYQDFSKGRLTLSYEGSLDFHAVTEPAASLPKNYRGQILRHDDGTTWYVDKRDVRHWIPDGGTWECLNHRGSQELGHVPGYAIATLELGDPATCSK